MENIYILLFFLVQKNPQKRCMPLFLWEADWALMEGTILVIFLPR